MRKLKNFYTYIYFSSAIIKYLVIGRYYYVAMKTICGFENWLKNKLPMCKYISMCN